jgi:hypothetical protein
MGIKEDMRAILPLNGNGNSSYGNENLPDAMYGRGSYYVMRALAKRTILVRCTVHMDVHNLDGGAEQQEDGNGGNEQKTHARVLRS